MALFSGQSFRQNLGSLEERDRDVAKLEKELLEKEGELNDIRRDGLEKVFWKTVGWKLPHLQTTFEGSAGEFHHLQREGWLLLTKATQID